MTDEEIKTEILKPARQAFIYMLVQNILPFGIVIYLFFNVVKEQRILVIPFLAFLVINLLHQTYGCLKDNQVEIIEKTESTVSNKEKMEGTKYISYRIGNEEHFVSCSSSVYSKANVGDPIYIIKSKTPISKRTQTTILLKK